MTESNMGFFQKYRASRKKSNPLMHGSQVETVSEVENQHTIRVNLSASFGIETDLIQLAGTTTYGKDAMQALAVRHGIEEGGYLEIECCFQREPENIADPMAIAAYVEGERIGYLPSPVLRYIYVPIGSSISAPVQIFTEMLPKGLRAEAWAWFGEGQPQWKWSKDNRPPLSTQAKAHARQLERSKLVRDGLAEGGYRAEGFKRGMVKGVHYLELVEPINELKREGRLEEALSLCYIAIEGAEKGRDGREPAPWYTEQAAIIHRKLGQQDKEIEVLNRWLEICPPSRRSGSKIAERLAKIQQKNA